MRLHAFPLALSLLFVLSLSLPTASATLVGTNGTWAPRRILNLDLPAEQRWTDIALEYAHLSPQIMGYFSGILSKEEMEIMEVVGGRLRPLMGEYGVEIEGLAQALNVPVGTLVILNFSYELRRLGGPTPNITLPAEIDAPMRKVIKRMGACTSIVAQDVNGHVWHGRNLDWNVPDELKQVLLDVDFQRNGTTLFTGTMFVGFVGVLSGQRPGIVSITIDERDTGGSVVIDSLNALLEGAASPTHLIRKTLETATSYTSALSTLQHTRLTAPSYFILAGPSPGQGAIITRDRTGPKDTWTLGLGRRDWDSWFLLQTNYDNWEPAPAGDDRRDPGIRYMQEMGQTQLSMGGLFDVLSRWPVRNTNTAYSVVMSPLLGVTTTFVQYTGANSSRPSP